MIINIRASLLLTSLYDVAPAGLPFDAMLGLAGAQSLNPPQSSVPRIPDVRLQVPTGFWPDVGDLQVNWPDAPLGVGIFSGRGDWQPLNVKRAVMRMGGKTLGTSVPYDAFGAANQVLQPALNPAERGAIPLSDFQDSLQLLRLYDGAFWVDQNAANRRANLEKSGSLLGQDSLVASSPFIHRDFSYGWSWEFIPDPLTSSIPSYGIWGKITPLMYQKPFPASAATQFNQLNTVALNNAAQGFTTQISVSLGLTLDFPDAALVGINSAETDYYIALPLKPQAAAWAATNSNNNFRGDMNSEGWLGVRNSFITFPMTKLLRDGVCDFTENGASTILSVDGDPDPAFPVRYGWAHLAWIRTPDANLLNYGNPPDFNFLLNA